VCPERETVGTTALESFFATLERRARLSETRPYNQRRSAPGVLSKSGTTVKDAIQV